MTSAEIAVAAIPALFTALAYMYAVHERNKVREARRHGTPAE